MISAIALVGRPASTSPFHCVHLRKVLRKTTMFNDKLLINGKLVVAGLQLDAENRPRANLSCWTPARPNGCIYMRF